MNHCLTQTDPTDHPLPHRATNATRRSRCRTLLASLLACAAVTLGLATATLAQVDAITTASFDLRMGFTVDGRLLNVNVEAGDRVKAGDVLMQLEDFEGQALILQYELKANSDLVIRSAQEQLRLAKIEAQAVKELFEKNAAPPIELDRANVKAAIATLEVENAKQMVEEARLLLKQAAARHERYTLIAPIDGVIDTLVGRPGESVESLKPVIRLVNTDTLYIDAAVPTDQTLTLKPGDNAWVTFKILSDKPAVTGRILYLAQVADSASDTRIVRIETPNPYGLPAGGAVSVSFTAPPASDTTSSTTGQTDSQAASKAAPSSNVQHAATATASASPTASEDHTWRK